MRMRSGSRSVSAFARAMSGGVLEQKVGRTKFTAFLRNWFQQHRHEAVGTDTFERELAVYAGQDFSAFFQRRWQTFLAWAAPGLNECATGMTHAKKLPGSRSYLRSSTGQKRSRIGP